MSGVLIVVDHIRGALSGISTEMIGLATQIKAMGEHPVRIVIIGPTSTPLCQAVDLQGVDEIVQVDSTSGEFAASEYHAVAETMARLYRPRFVLIGHNANGMAYAGGLAVALGAEFGADVFSLQRSGDKWAATRSGFGNKLNVTLGFSEGSVIVLTVRGGSYKAPTAKGTATHHAVPAVTPSVDRHWIHERLVEPPSEGIDISKSEFILSIGRGIQDEKNVPRFAAIAERLGATLACSRPVADSGWLQKSRQVGLTGKPASSCKLYLALGISGAVQHQWGMKHVETIIAVNTDPTAPIFGIATFGAVIDIFSLASSLEKILKLTSGVSS